MPKIKLHPVVRRLRRKLTPRPIPTSPDDFERKAIVYAQWLAGRDGVTLPDPKAFQAPRARAIWSGVYTDKRTWRGFPTFEKRISCVQWGRWTEQYNIRKDGRQGAYIGKTWSAELTIDLPNWDWIPVCIDLSKSAAIAA